TERGQGLLVRDTVASSSAGHQEIRRLRLLQNREHSLRAPERRSPISIEMVLQDLRVIRERVHLGIRNGKALPEVVVHHETRCTRVVVKEITSIVLASAPLIRRPVPPSGPPAATVDNRCTFCFCARFRRLV